MDKSLKISLREDLNKTCDTYAKCSICRKRVLYSRILIPSGHITFNKEMLKEVGTSGMYLSAFKLKLAYYKQIEWDFYWL